MKVAITGISSYFASAIMQFLEKDDKITEILGLDIVEPKLESAKLTFQKRDVRDPQMVDDLKGYDVLIHLAFIVSPIRNKKLTYSVNIDGSKNVFNCAVKAGVKKIIHASSTASYGAFPDNPVPITEEHPTKIMEPKFYYNETKVLVERYLDEIERDNPNIIITRLRPQVVLGLNMNNPLKAMFKGKNVVSLAPDTLVQVVWGEDVAQAFYLALIKDAPGAFNLGGDDPLTLRDLGKKMNKEVKVIPYKLAIFFVAFFAKLRIIKSTYPGWVRVMRYPIVVDTSKAKKILGWKPKYDTYGTITAFLECLAEMGE